MGLILQDTVQFTFTNATLNRRLGVSTGSRLHAFSWEGAWGCTRFEIGLTPDRFCRLAFQMTRERKYYRASRTAPFHLSFIGVTIWTILLDHWPRTFVRSDIGFCPLHQIETHIILSAIYTTAPYRKPARPVCHDKSITGTGTTSRKPTENSCTCCINSIIYLPLSSLPHYLSHQWSPSSMNHHYTSLHCRIPVIKRYFTWYCSNTTSLS
jgi:hypothetical protein